MRGGRRCVWHVFGQWTSCRFCGQPPNEHFFFLFTVIQSRTWTLARPESLLFIRVSLNESAGDGGAIMQRAEAAPAAKRTERMASTVSKAALTRREKLVASVFVECCWRAASCATENVRCAETSSGLWLFPIL